MWYDRMWSYTVELFRSMEIPVRTLECCSGDLAAVSYTHLLYRFPFNAVSRAFLQSLSAAEAGTQRGSEPPEIAFCGDAGRDYAWRHDKIYGDDYGSRRNS